jgi:hypothetical protein
MMRGFELELFKQGGRHNGSQTLKNR